MAQQAGTSSFADPSYQRPMTARADIRSHHPATAAPQRQSSARTRDDATAALPSGTPSLPHSIHSASQHPACATCAYAQLLRVRVPTNQEGMQSAQVSGEHRRLSAISHERSVQKKREHTLEFSAHALQVLPECGDVYIYTYTVSARAGAHTHTHTHTHTSRVDTCRRIPLHAVDKTQPEKEKISMSKRALLLLLYP